MNAVPDGHEKLIYLDLPGPTPEHIRAIAKTAPGSVWYVLGEPNRRLGYSADYIVPMLHDIYEEIISADPTARITSPSILNWDFDCNGCSGYQLGYSWVEEFRSSYLQTYGTEPPVDIWAIDVYPIDWETRPTVDHKLAIEQIEGLREYLDSIPDQQGKPIWVTELSLHWGWDDWEWFIEGCEINGISVPSPAGDYQTGQVINYLDTIFNWLEANSGSKKIERWFLSNTYYDIETCNKAAYAGLTLFDSSEVGAKLTEVGQFFADRIQGER